MTQRGDFDALGQLTDEELVWGASNDTLEIPYGTIAMVALPALRGQVLVYEPISKGTTGLGFVELATSATAENLHVD